MNPLTLPKGCNLRCQACSHRELGYAESLTQKQEWLRKSLSKWESRLAPVEAAPEESRLNYRRKALLSAKVNGAYWEFGTLRRISSRSRDYELIEIHDCPVHSEQVRKICHYFSRTLPLDIPLVYLAVSGTLVTLVLKSKTPISIPVSDFFPLGLRGVFLNLNPVAGKRVFDPRRFLKIWGEDQVEENGFFYGPASFQQLIPKLHEKTLREAEDFFCLEGNDSVLDLCSGLGQSLARWKNHARTLGVELSAEAVRLSGQNLGNLDLILRGKVSDRIPQLDWWQKAKPGRLLVYANPPRLGLEAKVLDWLIQSARPAKIAYLSCSAGTLAKDLSRLEDGGYTVKRITPYDFFPQTHHVETLTSLELDSRAHIRGALSTGSNSRPQ